MTTKAEVGTASIADIDTAKTIYIIGSNPRNEAPTLNARIRKAWLNGAEVKLIGEPVTYPMNITTAVQAENL